MFYALPHHSLGVWSPLQSGYLEFKVETVGVVSEMAHYGSRYFDAVHPFGARRTIDHFNFFFRGMVQDNFLFISGNCNEIIIIRLFTDTRSCFLISFIENETTFFFYVIAKYIITIIILKCSVNMMWNFNCEF